MRRLQKQGGRQVLQEGRKAMPEEMQQAVQKGKEIGISMGGVERKRTSLPFFSVFVMKCFAMAKAK